MGKFSGFDHIARFFRFYTTGKKNGPALPADILYGHCLTACRWPNKNQRDKSILIYCEIPVFNGEHLKGIQIQPVVVLGREVKDAGCSDETSDVLN